MVETCTKGDKISPSLTVEQILELLELTTAGPPEILPAALLCRAEKLLLEVTGGTSVDALLVDRWFNKLLHFSAASATSTAAIAAADKDGKGNEGAAVTARVSGRRSCIGEDDGAGGSRDETSPAETEFEARAGCDIGEGVAGMAAMTGRKLRVRDCRRQKRQQQDRGLEYSAHRYCAAHDSGSLICWPVRARTSGGITSAAAAWREVPPPLAQLEDVDENDDDGDNAHGPVAAVGPGLPEEAAVLAVLQLHRVEGLLSAEAVGFLHIVGRLLAPLLAEAPARDEERARRCSAEALLSLSGVDPREASVVAVVEEVLRAAQAVTGAVRACFFFVDDSAGELWVAKAVDLDDARVKVGEGLCGHAAATGGTVNVIDSYLDSRPASGRRACYACRFLLQAMIQHRNSGIALAAGAGTGGGLGEGRCTSSRRFDSAGLQIPPPVSTSVDPPRRPMPTSPRHRHPRSSHEPARPLAVLEVINKRGGGVFGRHDEAALVRLCACVESLLRRKAAEVSLLRSGLTERSLIRKGAASPDGSAASPDGGAASPDGGAASPDGGAVNCASVESTIMRLYSEVSPPKEVAEGGAGETQARRRSSAAMGGGGGGSAGAECEARADHEHSTSRDRMWGDVGLVKTSSDFGGSGSSVHLRCGSDSAVSGKAATVHNGRGGGDGNDGIDRTLAGDTAQQESELVDLGIDLFDQSSNRLLSLVGRFFRSLGGAGGAVSDFGAEDGELRARGRATLSPPPRPQPGARRRRHPDVLHDHQDHAGRLLAPVAGQARRPRGCLLPRHRPPRVILEDGGANNIFSELTRAEFRDARQTIVKAILGTDMSGHMQQCADVFQFAQKAKRLRAGGGQETPPAAAAATPGSIRQGKGQGRSWPRHERYGSEPAAGHQTPGGAGGVGRRATISPPAPPAHVVFSVHRPKDRAFLTQTIVHCADLSGQVLDNPLALEWGRRILEEFRLQARLEAAAGLSLTTIASADMETTMKGQHYFANKIVKPLWEPFVVLFPELAPLLRNLSNNCDHYFQEGRRLEQRRLSAAVPSPPPDRTDSSGKNKAG